MLTQPIFKYMKDSIIKYKVIKFITAEEIIDKFGDKGFGIADYDKHGNRLNKCTDIIERQFEGIKYINKHNEIDIRTPQRFFIVDFMEPSDYNSNKEIVSEFKEWFKKTFKGIDGITDYYSSNFF